jgi:Ca2+-dependent lipid-binding protein
MNCLIYALHIRVIRGEKLPDLDAVGSSDHYVVIQLGDKKFQANFKKNTVNPEWNENFDFRLPIPSTERILFTVIDKDVMNDDFMGITSILIDAIAPNFIHEIWLDINCAVK